MAEPTVLQLDPLSLQDDLATISERGSTTPDAGQDHQAARRTAIYSVAHTGDEEANEQVDDEDDDNDGDDYGDGQVDADSVTDSEEDEDEDEEEEEEEEEEEGVENVEAIVAEDMRKLEESFKGISQRFRLINRIGE
ncbi:hypothetical protein KEM54_003767, partial [Ascosphaera aggregata]